MSKTKDYIMDLEEKFFDSAELAVNIGNDKVKVLASLEEVRSKDTPWIPVEDLEEFVEEQFSCKHG
tara:strand:- start:115 stop:312 length:198 start_codon:yes stop_codon:yes gene_type:complete